MQKQQNVAAGLIGDDPNGCRQLDWASQVDDDWFWELIRGRRSVRRYRPDPIAQPLLEKLLTAAIWAPSAHNRQPWRFCVVTTEPAKQELSDRMGARWRADLGADGVDAALVERRVRISHARITGAPALVAASVSVEEMDDYPDQRRQEAEWLMAVQSTGPGLPESAAGSAPIRLGRLLDVRAPVRSRSGAGCARPAGQLASPGADHARIRRRREAARAASTGGTGDLALNGEERGKRSETTRSETTGERPLSERRSVRQERTPPTPHSRDISLLNRSWPWPVVSAGPNSRAGLQEILPPGALTVIVNTGDDFEHWGLTICPDIDTVLYGLAGVNNPQMGWGRAAETWNVLAEMERLGGEAWFRLGDKDLALHLLRNRWLKSGATLTGSHRPLAPNFGRPLPNPARCATSRYVRWCIPTRGIFLFRTISCAVAANRPFGG